MNATLEPVVGLARAAESLGSGGLAAIAAAGLLLLVLGSLAFRLAAALASALFVVAVALVALAKTPFSGSVSTELALALAATAVFGLGLALPSTALVLSAALGGAGFGRWAAPGLELAPSLSVGVSTVAAAVIASALQRNLRRVLPALLGSVALAGALFGWVLASPGFPRVLRIPVVWLVVAALLALAGLWWESLRSRLVHERQRRRQAEEARRRREEEERVRYARYMS